jgi:serine/threonine protein kinase
MLKAGTNWDPDNRMLKFKYTGGITKTKFGLKMYSDRASELTTLVLNNNSYDHASIEELWTILHGFSSLKHLSLDKNPIGSKGLLHLSHFLAANTVLQELSLSNCSIEFLPSSFVSSLVNLTTCLLKENPLIPWPASEVLGRSENAQDIIKLFSQPIDNVSRENFILIHEYLSHRCTAECLEMMLGLIQFKENGSQFCTSDCAKLWTVIVGVSFEADSLYGVIEKFIEQNVAAWSVLASCSDEYDRKAIMLAVGATRRFLSDRCFFMGLYDIPHGMQHEYKSATCTVYIVDRVEHNKRTRVALKFMKNTFEFEREKASREILSALSPDHSSQDCVIEAIASYKWSDCEFQAAVQRCGWLVDYASPCLLVMPAADRNLRIIMDNERITKPEVIKCMFQQLLDCVKFMHERCYIHGDLKPRNIMRIQRCLKLIDFDASAQIGQQYSWSKHSSAYMPPEAIRVSLSLVCDDLVVSGAPNSAQFTVEFKFPLPMEVAAGSTFTITFSPVNMTGVLSLMLDDTVDLSTCMSVKDHAITVVAMDALAAGSRRFTMVATFNDNPTAAGSVNARLEHVVNTLRPVQGASKDGLTKCTVTIRNPMKDTISSQEEQQVSSPKTPSAVAERHAQSRPESSSRPLQTLAPTKRAPSSAAALTLPYPLFLSESAIASTSSKLPPLPVDDLSPTVAKAATLMQDEYSRTATNVQQEMRSLRQAWASLQQISAVASGALSFAELRLLSFL